MNRFKSIFYWYRKFPRLVTWNRKLKRFTLPGFDKIPVYDVLIFLLNEIRKNALVNRAKAIAFSFFIALFPATIFLFALIPYIPIDTFQQDLLDLVSGFFPDQKSFNLIHETVRDVVVNPKGGLLSFGLLASLYFATNGVISMMLSFDKTYSIYKQRNFLQKRWIALKVTTLLMLMFLLSVAAIVAGEGLIKLLLSVIEIDHKWVKVLFNSLRYIIFILLSFYSLAMIYHYAPATREKWRFITPGATVATILSVTFSLAFSYYVENFGEYNKFYGSIGTIVLILIWMYLNAIALLIGFELNASIYYHKNFVERTKKVDNWENAVYHEDN